MDVTDYNSKLAKKRENFQESANKLRENFRSEKKR